MELTIKNYKNIENLDLTIDDHKINYIFGISGSGKSSIGKAFTGNLEDEDVMVGKSKDEVSILINEKSFNDLNVNIFNENSVKSLIAENNMEEAIYRILFSDGDTIFQLQNEFKEQTKDLSIYQENLWKYVGKIDTLIQNYGGRFTNKDKLYASTKLGKYKNELQNSKNNDYINLIQINGSNYLKWMKEGTEFEKYKISVCPFCEEKLTSERKTVIDDLSNYIPNNFSVLYEDTSILDEFRIEKPIYSDISSVEKFEAEIVAKIKLKDEILKIINIIRSYMNINNFSTIEAITTTGQFNKIFPELKKPIKAINDKIFEINALLEKLKKATNETIENNIEKLNTYLEKFGIPYKFKVNDVIEEEAKASYLLYHINDKQQKQRINGLSYGEKNIIALLLFIASNQNKIVIIDDPASSFDDYRRYLIFELLYKFHKRETYLILSHDPVFVKYANFYSESPMKKNAKEMYEKKTGKKYHFSNYESNSILTTIEWEDFESISTHIMKHLEGHPAMPYYQKIMNLRVLVELDKETDENYKLIYGYVSEILHGRVKKLNMSKWFSNKKTNEKKILQLIKDNYNIDLEKMPVNLLDGLKMEDLTNFEKIIYFREEKNCKFKDEFDDIVHLNSVYAILLNPYKFDYFSPHIHAEICNLNKEKEVNINELCSSGVN